MVVDHIGLMGVDELAGGQQLAEIRGDGSTFRHQADIVHSRAAELLGKPDRSSEDQLPWSCQDGTRPNH